MLGQEHLLHCYASAICMVYVCLKNMVVLKKKTSQVSPNCWHWVHFISNQYQKPLLGMYDAKVVKIMFVNRLDMGSKMNYKENQDSGKKNNR